jgi:predicted nuclease of predicted toxin-antitoxin system
VKPRLLIDENLPAGLAEALGESGLMAIEVGDRSTDKALWEYARREGMVIMTKDADFFDKLAVQGAPPK